ncbi:MAG: TetR/AcrR family transcriptional regulator [Sphingomonadales bacterium]|nr:TetR/AcrR family transcriptional regulator [Sphingomonadales bacterium]
MSNAILDATEQVMREEGYGAVSSRRVAEVAGIRQGLVYYYFETMDDLLLAAFKRRTASGLARYEQQVSSERPLLALWKDLTENVDGRLVFEFVALANHHDGIREEVNRFLGAARRLQADAIARDAANHGLDIAPATPTALAFILYSATLMMAREQATGLTEGHDEVRALFSVLMDKFA